MYILSLISRNNPNFTNGLAWGAFAYYSQIMLKNFQHNLRIIILASYQGINNPNLTNGWVQDYLNSQYNPNLTNGLGRVQDYLNSQY